MKNRLSVLFFLQFAVWGTYLVSLGQYLGAAGMGSHIQWFYAVGGFAALFMPALAGAVADRYVSPQRLLALCHLIAATAMLGAFAYGLASAPTPDFAVMLTLFTLSVAFYIPTLSLANSASFALLAREKIDTVKAFPRIRVWGTVGFVVMMWVVNSVWIVPGEGIGITFSDTHPHAMQRMQYTVMQLGACGVVGLLTFVYALTLPSVASAGRRSPGGVFGSLRLLADRRLLPFFLFSMLIGVALQINNGYVAPYLTHFRGLPEYASTFGANNATMLSSLSQISEALWILPVGFILARAGIKLTVLTAMLAWVVNFLCFALGDTGSGLWLIVTAMIVYGVAFNFFNVAGALFVDRTAPEGRKSAAQGLLMMMTKGVGASAGMLAAGAVVNHFCRWTVVDGQRYLTGDWTSVWLVFTAYCLVTAICFALFFRTK